MKKNLYFYRGLTLVELLVGISVGLVILSAAGSAMMSYMKSYSDSQKILNLNQNMRGVMDLMAREIRRAGYMSSDVSDIDGFKNNPFFEDDNDLAVHSYDGVEDGCITFSYNLNKNLTVESSEPNERFGFRLSDKKVQMRKSGGGSGCAWVNNSYESITDEDILVDELEFTMQGDQNSEAINIDKPDESCVVTPEEKNCLYIRSVRIELTAHIENDPEIKQTLVQTVKIRNNKFKPKEP